MAIAAQRHKVLDRETNIAFIDFTKVTSNDSYNLPIAGPPKLSVGGGSSAGGSGGKIDDIMDAVQDTTDAMTKKLKDLLNTALDKINKMDLPDSIKDMLNYLKNTDLEGFKSWFQETLNVGAPSLCNTSGVLSNYYSGHTVSENVMSGAIMDLLTSWMDRVCSTHSEESLASMSPLGKIESMVGSTYKQLTPDELLSSFMAFNRNSIGSRYSGIQSLTDSISSYQYLSKLFNQGKDEANFHLQYTEISDDNKDLLITDSYLRLSEPIPSFSSISDKLNTLTNMTEKEAMDYSDFLGAHYPITGKDVSDILTITTGKYGKEERRYRTQQVINDVKLEHEVDIPLIVKLNSLNDLSLVVVERDVIIAEILEQLNLEGVVSPELENSIRDIGRLNITEEESTLKLEELLTRIATYTPHEDRESKLLDALGDLKDLPMISQSRREDAIFNGNLSDRLGVFVLQLSKSDLSLINSDVLNSMEKIFLEKLKEMQLKVRKDSSIVSRDNSIGSWSDVDFSKLFPVLTEEEQAYIDNLPDTADLGTHRPLDLHPTSLLMIGEIHA